MSNNRGLGRLVIYATHTRSYRVIQSQLSSVRTSFLVAATTAALAASSTACSRGQLDRAAAGAALDTSAAVQRIGATYILESAPLVSSTDACGGWLKADSLAARIVATGYVRPQNASGVKRVGNWLMGWSNTPGHYCRLVATEKLTAAKSPATRWDLVAFPHTQNVETNMMGEPVVDVTQFAGYDKTAWLVPAGPCTGLTVTGIRPASSQGNADHPTELLADATCTVTLGQWQATVPGLFPLKGVRFAIVGNFKKYDDGWRLTDVASTRDTTQVRATVAQ